MTSKKALAEAVRLWGKRAAVEDRGPKFRDGTKRPASQAERDVVKQEAKDHAAKRPTIAPLDAWDRTTTIGAYLDALAEHKEEMAAWKKINDRFLGISYSHRFQVGEIMSGPFAAFHVKGVGDTWEEAFAQAR